MAQSRRNGCNTPNFATHRIDVDTREDHFGQNLTNRFPAGLTSIGFGGRTVVVTPDVNFGAGRFITGTKLAQRTRLS